MIHNVYILDSNGIPIVSRIYGNIQVDPTLIAGYISAQSTFFKEITGQDVEMIQTKDYNFWLKRIGKFLLAIVTSKDADSKLVKWKLSQIQLAFIMNIEKNSLYPMVDCVVLKSLDHILNSIEINDLVNIIIQLLADEIIIIKGNKIADIEKFIFTLLGISPDFKETYIYSEKKTIYPNSIIGIEKDFDVNTINDLKFIIYDIDAKKLIGNNLNLKTNDNLSEFINQILNKAKVMDELTAIDYLKNNLKKIKKEGNILKEYILANKSATTEEVRDILDISLKELPVILELISLSNSFIKKDNEIIYYAI